MPFYKFYFPEDGQKAEDAVRFFSHWSGASAAEEAASMHLETLHADGVSDLLSDLCVLLDQRGHELGRFRISVEWEPHVSAEEVKP